jgi:hypothetical protein
MTVLYASTFTKALGRLTAAEQKMAKVTAFDLAQDTTGNGLQLHRVDRTDGFWTARVSKDLRIVLHKSGDQMLLAYVDHHDAAYRWAERRRLVPHERTGAMQFVVVVEQPNSQDQNKYDERASYERGSDEDNFGTTIESATGADFVTARSANRSIVALPFATLSDDQLLDIGVPRAWLDPVRAADQTSVKSCSTCFPTRRLRRCSTSPLAGVWKIMSQRGRRRGPIHLRILTHSVASAPWRAWKSFKRRLTRRSRNGRCSFTPRNGRL